MLARSSETGLQNLIQTPSRQMEAEIDCVPKPLQVLGLGLPIAQGQT
jgi:hypothetical protein